MGAGKAAMALLTMTLSAWAMAQPIIQARLAERIFQLELAELPEERRMGLMGRSELAPDSGMLFDFPPETVPSIWMRNMQIPLDLLFVDDSGKLIKVFSDVPPCPDLPCEVYRADQVLRFVIEVPAGTATRLGLRSGDVIDLGGYQLSPAPRF